MDVLLMRLNEASQRFAHEQLLGAVDAMEAVRDYLLLEGITAKQMLPLAWLDNHLTQEKFGKPFYEEVQLATAAAAVDILMSLGVKLPEACKNAAKATGGALDADKLRNWRKNTRAASKNQPGVRHFYDQQREALEWAVGQLKDGNDAPKLILQMVSDRFGIKIG
jgi:hypothetical protein